MSASELKLALVISAIDKATAVVGAVSESFAKQASTVDAVAAATDAASGAQKALSVTIGTLESAYAAFGDQAAHVGQEMARLDDISEALGPSMLAASKQLGFGIERTTDGGLDLVKTVANIEKRFGSLQNMSPQVAAQMQKAFGSTAFKALLSVRKETENFSARMAKVSQAMRVVRENVQDFTDRAKAAMGTLLAASADVDGAMASLAQSTKLLGDSEVYDRAKGASLAWSSAHAQSAADYIRATKLMVAADHQYAMTNEQVFAATDAAMRLAAGTQGEVAASTQTLIAVYGQVGDKSADAGAEFGRLGDQLTRLGQLFPSLNVAELADPLKDVLPVARGAKVSFEQVAVALGRFSEMGIKGGEAGAAVAGLIASLEPASKKLGFTLAKTADGGLDLAGTLATIEKKFGPIDKMTPKVAAKLQEAFGGDAWRGLTMMSGQAQTLADAVSAVGDSAGAAASAQAEFESTTAAQAQIAQQQFDAIKVTLAAGLLPAIQQLLPIVTDLAQRFAAFASENPELVTMIGTAIAFAVAIGSVIAPILSAAGAVSGFIGALEPLLAFVAANPIVLAVLAIAAAAYLIYEYWEPISDFFVDLWAGIEKIWSNVLGFFTGIFDEIKGAFQESFVGGLMKLIMFLSPVTWFVRAFQALWPWLQEVGPKIWDALVSGLAALGQFNIQLGIWLLEGLDSLWNSLVGWVKSLGDAMLAGFKSMGALIWQGIQNDMGRVIGWLRSIDLTEVGRNIVNTITSGIKAMANAPYDAMLGIVQKVRNLLPFSPAKEGPFMDLDKVRIVETVAEAVKPAPLVEAMTGATAQTMQAIAAVRSPEIAMPTFASMPAAVASQAASNRNGGADAGGGNITVQIIVQGGSTEEGTLRALKRLLEDPANAPKVARLANLGNERTERRKIG